MARPSKYNEKIAKKILDLYSTGETISKIIKLKGMPARNTIYLWRSAVPAFGKAYDVALEGHVEALVDEALMIVDTELDPKRAKVRAEQRNWMAAKLNRTKYGDKIDVLHNVIVDITPALLEATKRMKEIKGDNGKKMITVNAEPCH